ncbi:MAG: catechol 1,2-dioxygenase [Actinobacteria bacterium]|nr:catechol 1,2-dioxygenase [Actinomycetota bacterium]
MGEIVGAAIVSHVPPIVMNDADLAELYGPEGTTLVDGLHRIRRERLDALDPDTIVVFDTHWFTTVEHIISSHARRSGIYTSDELPRGMRQVPYDLRGDPDLALAFEQMAQGRDDTRALACDDPYLPIHYPTTNLLQFLQDDEAWVSMGICQTGTPDDWLLAGALLGRAIAGLDRKVVLLASGGLSHRFWPLREFARHETASLDHIRTPEARAADERVLDLLQRGDHATVIDEWPQYRTFSPEGFFAHYLMMVGAIGGRECTAPGTMFSAYESAAGTGQAHIWFDGPFSVPTSD